MPPAKPALAASDHPSFRAPYAPADEGLAVALLAGETYAASCRAIAPRVFDAAGNAAVRRLISIGPKREPHLSAALAGALALSTIVLAPAQAASDKTTFS